MVEYDIEGGCYMNHSILEEFKLKSNEIVDETKTFDFPFLSNEEKKMNYIEERKNYVDRCFHTILPQRTVKIVWPDAILWNEAKEYADEKFASLPKKVQLNGFYLQELMYEYAKRVSEYLIEQFLLEEGEQ